MGMSMVHNIIRGRFIVAGMFMVIMVTVSVMGWGFARGDSQVIQTVAGTGVPGFSGDGGEAASAQMNVMQGLVLDAAGNLYVAEPNNQVVRKVSPSGIIMTIAGIPAKAGFNGDDQPATQAQLATPSDVLMGPDGNLYIADNGNHRIRRIDNNGVITTVVGTGTAGFSGDGGGAIAAQLRNPASIAFDAAGNLYIGDAGNLRIRMVESASGKITTIAGTGAFGYDGDGGAAYTAKFKNVSDLVVSPSGDIYVADTYNNRVRRVSNGVISTVAGNGTYNVNGEEELRDGSPATEAIVRWPFGLSLDSSGNLFIAENASNRIRRVDNSGLITTVAGSGDPRISGSDGDGGPALEAKMNGPSGVVVDASGNIYISDSRNFRVRKVNGQ